MKKILNLPLLILHRIYFVWVALLFLVTLLISFVLIMASQLLPKRPALKVTNFILRSWSLVWGTLIGLRFKQFFRKSSYFKEPMVIVTNHNSFLDTVVSYIHIKGAFRTLAKKELLRTPIMGPIFGASGIMVDRSSAESRKQSFERMVDTLKGGTSLFVYPEGTQNRTNEFLQPFFEGAFRAAVAAQVPVLPVVTINARQIMPQAKFMKIRPGLIRQYFLEPIPTVGLKDEDVEALRDRVHALMAAKVKELDPTYPGSDRKPA